MANPQKGEVDLTLGGQTYTLRLGAGALIALQESLREHDGTVTPLEQIFAQAIGGRVLAIRAVLWAGLQRHHPTMTLAGVEDILDAASEAEVATLLRGLAGSTSPDPADAAALGVTGAAAGRPRTARGTRRGTGVASISTPAGSA